MKTCSVIFQVLGLLPPLCLFTRPCTSSESPLLEEFSNFWRNWPVSCVVHLRCRYGTRDFDKEVTKKKKIYLWRQEIWQKCNLWPLAVI